MKQDELAPLFGLYGEAIEAPAPGFVHIEDVAARSRALDWRIESHRHGNLFQVLCIFDGAAEVRFDDHVRALTDGSVITIPPGVVHAFLFTPATEGVVLTVAEELLDATGEFAYLESVLLAPQLIRFDTDDDLFAQLRAHLRFIAAEFDRPQSGHSVVLTSLVKVALTIIARQAEETRLDLAAGGSDSKILKGFRDLLERNYAKQWSIEAYADALNTSVSSLNRRCKRYLGLTAKSILQNRVLLAAKRRLIYTRAPVEQIAWSLGFTDPAYFSRFFRKWEGVPPGRYRQNAAERTTG